VGAVADGAFGGGFAGAEAVAFGFGDDEFDGGEGGALVGAVAEGLGFGEAALAPPVGSGLEFEDDGGAAGASGSVFSGGGLVGHLRDSEGKREF